MVAVREQILNKLLLLDILHTFHLYKIFHSDQVAQKYDIPPEMIKAVYKKTKKG